MATVKNHKVTIKDVAQAAGVSAMTVSRVLNNKGEISEATRQRVLQVIDDLNYKPSRIARSLATKRTYTMGLVVPDIANPYFAEITHGAQDVAWENDYNVFLCSTDESEAREESILRSLEESRIDGLILCSSRLPEDKLARLVSSHAAVVLTGHHAIAQHHVSVVRSDDADGMRQAVRHLLSTGHREIGFLAGPRSSRSSQERHRGFIETLHEAGQNTPEKRIQICPPVWQGGYEGVSQILENHPNLDALICFNDLVAIGALKACEEKGIQVPDDLAVVGFDDTLFATLSRPALTTVRIDKYQIGLTAATMLLEQIQASTGEKELILEEKLVVRESAP